MIGNQVSLGSFVFWDSSSTTRTLSEMVLWFAAITGLLAVGGTLSSTILANRSSDLTKIDADRRQEQAEERISQNEALTAVANRQAAADRLALAKIEGRFAPRRLTEEQLSSIQQALRPFTGHKIRLESYSLDLEGEIFADQLAGPLGKVFKLDNWVGSQNADSGFVKGVNVTGGDPAVVAAIAATFRAAGITGVSTKPLPTPTATVLAVQIFREPAKDVAAVITVGVKPLHL